MLHCKRSFFLLDFGDVDVKMASKKKVGKDEENEPLQVYAPAALTTLDLFHPSFLLALRRCLGLSLGEGGGVLPG